MKLIRKIKKIFISSVLTLALLFSSPAYVFAQLSPPTAPTAPESPTAPEAPTFNLEAPEAPEAPTAPSPPPGPTPPPSPSPSPTTWSSQQPSYNSSPSPSPSPSPKPKGVDSSGNTGGDTSINTGDAKTAGNITNNTNSNSVSTGDGGSCSACVGSSTAKNSGNGTGSNNDASVVQNNQTDLDFVNKAVVVNNANFEAITGDNKASKNTGGDSTIVTGDADVIANIITDANSVALDIYQFDVNDNQTGDIILDPAKATAVNSGNGADSTNDASVNTNNVLNQTVTNEGDIINNINLLALSGDNDASKNTGGDSTIVTGDANIVANVINTLNTIVTGALYSVNILGDLVGDIVAPQGQTASSCCATCNQSLQAANIDNGADSTNNATASSTNTTNVNQVNVANIENNLNLDANTGGNDANFNTGGDSLISTGDVMVDANVVNIANINVASNSCEPVHMVFINDPNGNWQGEIKGAIPGSYYILPDGTIYLVDASGALIAINSGNGAGSTNDASVNSTSTTTVNQTNVANITNNINAYANTGDNNARYNTNGNSTITTGDASILVNVINFVNSNFYGRSISMTVINVLGSWIGDFFGSGYSGDDNQNAQAQAGGSSSGSGGSGGGSSSESDSGGSSTGAIGGSSIGSGGGFGSLFGGFATGSGDSGSGSGGANSSAAPVTKYTNKNFNGSIFDWRYFVAALAFIIFTRLLEKRLTSSKKPQAAVAHEIRSPKKR